MIKEVLNNMKKVIKKEQKVVVKDCPCTNLAQEGGVTYCKDCGDLK